MADVRNCRKCGKIYNYIGGAPICHACKQLEEDDFQKVKEYLYAKPGATLTEVSTELEMSIEKIKRFLKEGRLEITDDFGNIVLECEGCGKSIKSGRFCEECERDLTIGLRSAARQIKSELDTVASSNPKSLGIRYLNKDYERK